jgi:hypothetical protein
MDVDAAYGYHEDRCRYQSRSRLTNAYGERGTTGPLSMSFYDCHPCCSAGRPAPLFCNYWSRQGSIRWQVQ